MVSTVVVVTGGGDAALQAIGEALGTPTDRVADSRFTFDDIFDGAHSTQ